MATKTIVVTEELTSRKHIYVHPYEPNREETVIHNVTKDRRQSLEEVGTGLTETLSHMLAIMPKDCNLSVTFQVWSTT